MTKKISKKTLIYNLILFDFILLETSSKKISNFFVEKIGKANNTLVRLSIFEIVKSFKQFIKLFSFIKKIKKLKKNTIYFWVNSEYLIDFFKFFFKLYKPKFLIKYSILFPSILKSLTLSSSIIINNLISKNEFYSFFFKKIWLLQSVNSINIKDFHTYKLYADLNDYKKLMFLALILNLIFSNK